MQSNKDQIILDKQDGHQGNNKGPLSNIDPLYLHAQSFHYHTLNLNTVFLLFKGHIFKRQFCGNIFFENPRRLSSQRENVSIWESSFCLLLMTFHGNRKLWSHRNVLFMFLVNSVLDFLMENDRLMNLLINFILSTLFILSHSWQKKIYLLAYTP